MVNRRTGKRGAIPPEQNNTKRPLCSLEDFDSAIELFLREGKIRNISPHTIAFYRRELGLFKSILERQHVNTDPNLITDKAIKEHIVLYMMDQGQKETSINCVLRSARALFNFLVREGQLEQSPMSNVSLVKQKKSVVAAFSAGQLRAIIEQADKSTFVGLRDRVIMMLFIETGVRVRELVDINVNDIVWREGVIVIDGKGYKQRAVPFQETMRKELARYVDVRGTLDHDRLFVTVDNTPITIRQVQEQISQYGRKAGVKGVRCSPHTFRHTFAKMSVQNGASMFALQAVLGHATLDQVRAYVHLFGHEVRKEHRRFSPLEKMY